MLLTQQKIISTAGHPAQDWIMAEACRCLQCYDPPCQKACPASIHIPDFIYSIKTDNLVRSAAIVRNANPMAAICGAICPAEVFCQAKCTRGKIDSPVKIRELHAYATRHENGFPSVVTTKNKHVAIIGAGPAGIACAAKLALKGIHTVAFERTSCAGGVPYHSIPRFRLSEEEIDADLNYAKKIGVTFATNAQVDDPSSLFGEFDAVFIAVGLSSQKPLGIPGEKYSGVIKAVNFLEDARTGRIDSLSRKNVVVIGGGNVSLDAASAASNLGAKNVRLLYRRGPEELRTWESELALAQQYGVVLEYLTAPIEFLADSGKLAAVKCIRTKLSDDRASDGRRRPIEMPGSEFFMAADLAIIAIGLKSDYKKDISVFQDTTTSIAGIFAGGEWARGPETIVEAVRDGKNAAEAILAYLKGKK